MAQIQNQAENKLPKLFLTEPQIGASQEIVDLDKYIQTKVDTLIFDQQMAVVLCDYLASKAIQWQETLPDNHFWKDVDMGESFDKAVYVQDCVTLMRLKFCIVNTCVTRIKKK